MSWEVAKLYRRLKSLKTVNISQMFVGVKISQMFVRANISETMNTSFLSLSFGPSHQQKDFNGGKTGIKSLIFQEIVHL